MSVICDSTLRGDIPIYVKALQCLVKIVTLYYEHIYAYMENGVIRVSVIGKLIICKTFKKHLVCSLFINLLVNT